MYVSPSLEIPGLPTNSKSTKLISCWPNGSEIFTVTWFPEEGEPAEGRRMITNAQAAIGDLSPVKTLKVKGKREKDEEGRVAKGRVSKVKTRSKAL